MMDNLLKVPTVFGWWDTVISESQCRLNVKFDENLKSYLIHLLMRFCRKSRIISDMLAQQLFVALQSSKHERIVLLRDVGDESLILSGFFSKLVDKRYVNRSCLMSIGQTAYYYLNKIPNHQFSEIAVLLGNHFKQIVDVLENISDYHYKYHKDWFSWIETMKLDFQQTRMIH